MKFRLFIFVFAAIVMVAFSVSAPCVARASILPSNLVGGVQNELEDDDFELLVNAGGTIDAPGAGTTIDVGDFLFGIARVTALRVPVGGSAIASATDTEASFTAYFMVKVAAVTTTDPFGVGNVSGGNDVNYVFAAPDLADWTAVVGAARTPVNAGTTLLLYADPTNIAPGLATASAALGSVDGTKLWEVGFDPTNPANFWRASSDTNDVLTSFAVVSGSFTAAQDVLGYFGGPELAPQAHFYTIPGPPGIASGFSDVRLVGGALTAGGTGAFGVRSDVDFLVTPVPEPASMLAWSGLICVGGLVARHRRRKAAC